jgi:hypothetical protein
MSRWTQIQKSLRLGDQERVEEIRRECETIIREARGRPAP